MSKYIEKRRIPVRLSQPGLDPIGGFLMLSPQWEDEDRPETLFELLNSPRAVIPFIQAEKQRVSLLIRTNIDWVAVSKDSDLRLVFPPSHQVSEGQHVQLSFSNGSRVEAFVQWRRTEQRYRLSDFLNECEDFFPVVAGFGLLFVNKQRVRETRIVEAAEREDSLVGVG